ncbi:bifunctional methylenetetrahydrofolate dehydrogenase/methenyltetrahydrofolate cyclohydrolase FolD [Aquibacillus sp. 3ASR75-11]|uniref:Bifunctional protein FolD n=1 Tax=Terrihalobacillus insolitus TaxID=2950438 RepID=A0A9X3WXW2_9BACI|nr:bifunctional methylenetetrahydrofolate dehydrogenase/methenyltetrahydrofolate cyclohydrolase FolD [Terrihalobacillus insolitus]MDC3414434.1 bifunctional methylenetetrahydrofolate dehydrogenase/methenyltetrahydrofolate cyclohydrolase FolD [Terrihalobacillus insolitus]MDC3425314.1 bifunctional methylenetetrahydrofolate dehydrogenase/methenyltetrahydrofolate cyclohydrolase FolD [Terrihalobacillus insolitus]
MAAEVIYGKTLSENLRQEMKEQVEKLKQHGVTPGLTVIIIGNDPASISYVRGKQRASDVVGIDSKLIEMDNTTSQSELLELIKKLNNDPKTHGILVQLPLPDHIDEQVIIEAIHPTKDVDGFHPINIGKMMTGKETFFPCTPYGIITMLKSKNIQIEGKHAVVVGRSNIVGKPVGQLLLNENATVTYIHSKTKNFRHFTKQADILVVAVGKEHFISGEDIKAGAVVIDVGINRNAEGKLTGDVEFESAKEKASYITPVPKGVGPMTITMLLHNTIKSAQAGLK